MSQGDTKWAQRDQGRIQVSLITIFTHYYVHIFRRGFEILDLVTTASHTLQISF